MFVVFVQDKPCPKFYFHYNGSTSQDEFKKTYDEAVLFCHKRRSTLPAPKNKKEYGCLKALNIQYPFWLGFKRNAREETFRDSVGNAMNYSALLFHFPMSPSDIAFCVNTVSEGWLRNSCRTEKFVVCQSE